VEKYYTSKILAHGVSPAGVDWNSEASQLTRFEQLIKVINEKSTFGILDYGCGYGALLKYLQTLYPEFEYTGFDISKEMLLKAAEKHKDGNPKWINTLDREICHYSIASGIFNVMLNHQDGWKEYVEDTLIDMFNRSTKGFSFNMLTKYSDHEYMKSHLFYADPAYYFDYCKRHFSKYIALLHDYPLFEFTIIVKKEL